jgi:small subunit ribosomal protein S1
VQALIEKPDAHVVEGSNGLLLEIDGQIVPNYDATMQPFEEGEVVTGRVVRIDKDEVLVDIGYKSEGVIPSGELSIRKSVDPREEVELGEEVDAIVLTKEDQDGRLIMSKKRARFEKAWRRIEAAAESGQPVEGNVIEVVKGGLIIDLGVRGFLPASLVDIRRVPNLDEYMGTKIETKVIELNRSRNNVVLSRRAVLEEERKEVRQQILDRLQPGLVVEGQISNIVDFGAFVDLDGIDGLIHISELSWSHVNHPSELLNIGDTVQVKVLDIDRDRQRISLGLKQTQEDPWQRIIDTYNIGDELEGTVTKVVTFGAFVEILDGVEGLVHISELAAHHVESPREIVHPGDEIRVKILEIDSERRRLSLSAKRVEDQILPLPRQEQPAGEPTGEVGASEGEPAAELAAEGPQAGAVEAPVPEQAPTEGVQEPPGEVADEPMAAVAEPVTDGQPVAEFPAEVANEPQDAVVEPVTDGQPVAEFPAEVASEPAAVGEPVTEDQVAAESIAEVASEPQDAVVEPVTESEPAAESVSEPEPAVVEPVTESEPAAESAAPESVVSAELAAPVAEEPAAAEAPDESSAADPDLTPAASDAAQD